MRSSDACRALDRAKAALEGREPAPADAIALRAAKRVFAPGESITIFQYWAYDTVDGSVTVRLREQNVVARPGETNSFSFAPSAVPQEDTDLTWEATVGENKVPVRFSIVRDLDKRLEKLKSSQSRVARDLAEGIQTAREPQAETVLPIARMLREAEELDAGRLEPAQIEEFLFARQGATILRAYVPKNLRGEAVVVLALHGAGGSENLFFEGYGAGLGVSEAKKRGWVFLSPRATPNASRDALQWLEEVRGIKPRRLFIMGHSMGGGLALGTGDLKPSAIALFAPAARAIPKNLETTPIFLAVGKQEILMLRTGALALAEAVKRQGEFKEYDPCEHLMIVAEALPDAYRFFDQRIKATGSRP
jgi:predicted esterase